MGILKANRKYIFSKEVSVELADFKAYLEDERYVTATIRQKCNYAGFYLSWLELEGMLKEKLNYNDMLCFIDYCKENGDSKLLINRKLQCIKNYYEYKQKENEENTEIVNPAINLFIRGSIRKLPESILNYKDLENIYVNYPTQSLSDKRNKQIIGLFIYQGINTGELRLIECSELDLNKGSIKIKAQGKRNARILDLKPCQILDLKEYLEYTRPEILRLNNIENELEVNNQLFISITGNPKLRGSMAAILKSIRKLNPKIKNIHQIRTTLTQYWLKQYDLRKVQYLLGHRYLSSTQLYKQSNTADL
jgi:integrase/recombinase XerD